MTNKPPTHDPHTGDLNPEYEKLTGEPNPLAPNMISKGPNMISKGPNKKGMDWSHRSPTIYTSVTEGDPNLQQVPALGVHDDAEVELMISHTDGQIVIDIIDDRYKSRMLLIEKRGGKLQICVWADADCEGDSGVYFASSPYLIEFKETEPEEAK